MRAKLYPLYHIVGFKKCAKDCCEAYVYVTGTIKFNSTVTGRSFKTNQQLNYDDRCIIYLLTWKQRQKRYTGQTNDNCIFRWNNYKSTTRKCDRKESCTNQMNQNDESDAPLPTPPPPLWGSPNFVATIIFCFSQPLKSNCGSTIWEGAIHKTNRILKFMGKS